MFLVDTETGKTWQFTEYTDLEGNPHVWQIVPRVDDETELFIWIGSKKFKKEPVPLTAPR